MSIIEVGAAQLELALLAGARLIDVREADEYESGHVAGARHVALGAVAEHVHEFQGADIAYVICRSGARSMRACELLALHGVEAINVAGGTLEWVAGGRPVVAGNQPL